MWFGAFPGAFGLGRAQPQRLVGLIQLGRHVVFLTRYDGELRGPLVQRQGLHCAKCAKVSSEALGPALPAKHIMGCSWVTCLWDMQQEEELNSQGGARTMMVPSFREH